MKSSLFPRHWLFILLIAAVYQSCNPAIQITPAHYQRAESLLAANIRKIVYHLEVQPNWLEDSSAFWHVTHTREGKRFFLTRIDESLTLPAFDHKALATALSEHTGKETDHADLPFDKISYGKDLLISFSYENVQWEFDTDSNRLSKIDAEDEDKLKNGVSPDGKLQAFICDYNLFLRDLETGEERQLSIDGRYKYEYASTYGWSDLLEGEGGKRPENMFVNWAPDSRKLLTYIADLSLAEKMYLLDFSIDSLFRPKLLSYYRGSPGDTTVVWYRPVIFDLDKGTEISADLDPIPHFIGVSFHWTEQSDSLFALFPHRGFKQADVIKMDAATGTSQVLISETSETSVEYGNLVIQRVGDDLLLFSSHKSGWHHLYLYDWNSGELVNTITGGEYIVKRLVHIDEEKEIIYFLAGGRESGRNPYFDHLYKVGFDGETITLLTPENAHHQVSLSPCKKYFVNNYSRVDLPTVSLLRELESGDTVFEISRADVADLFASGWKPPMTFTAKGRDGITDIYGVIYQPENFNPRKKYPIIDYTYTGPHTSITPKSFSNALLNIQNPLRAFGFAIIVVDGMGTAQRSKSFRDVSYMNMGYSLDCHVEAIRQLAARYNWMDTTKIGIFGHSAGGYDAGRAMLHYPDFYKVGVASAADHDHRMEKVWWPEMYMGYPVGDFYHEQSNITNAHKLQGRLLIAHGAIDENVNPSATYKLAEYLIRAGKDFDMLILPGTNHSFGRADGDYFTKVRWNYFIRHLLPAEPILHYQFETIK
jgi:dipeptidyl-peptidase 4